MALLNLPAALWRRLVLIGQGLSALLLLLGSGLGALFERGGTLGSQMPPCSPPRRPAPGIPQRLLQPIWC